MQNRHAVLGTLAYCGKLQRLFTKIREVTHILPDSIHKLLITHSSKVGLENYNDRNAPI